MSIQSFGDISSALENGREWRSYVTKLTTPAAAAAGFFVDLNQSSGVPKYNPLSGTELTATPLNNSGNFGVYPGNYIPGMKKYLQRWQGLCSGTGAAPSLVYLCDYLMYYTLIDGDSVDLQEMDNTLSLPRYTTGAGVRAAFVGLAPSSIYAVLTMNYINQDGVAKSSQARMAPCTNIGNMATMGDINGTNGAISPFFPLASGDSGIRSVTSVQLAGATGGFFCLVLVKPIAELNIIEIDVPAEKVFGLDKYVLPEIVEGAHLNFMMLRNATNAAAFRSELTFINV
jgi:hypothetical protein